MFLRSLGTWLWNSDTWTTGGAGIYHKRRINSSRINSSHWFSFLEAGSPRDWLDREQNEGKRKKNVRTSESGKVVGSVMKLARWPKENESLDRVHGVIGRKSTFQLRPRARVISLRAGRTQLPSSLHLPVESPFLFRGLNTHRKAVTRTRARKGKKKEKKGGRGNEKWKIKSFRPRPRLRWNILISSAGMARTRKERNGK